MLHCSLPKWLFSHCTKLRYETSDKCVCDCTRAFSCEALQLNSANNVSQYTALDGGLLRAFFISYSVLALVQLNNLFNGRFILFLAIAACTALATTGFEYSDFEQICGESPSAIMCGGTGRGLSALGLVWIYVSAAMFALFGLGQLIRALRKR